MPRTTQTSPDANDGVATSTPATGFDAVVHVPAGSSIDEAIGAAEEELLATSGMASAELTTTPVFDAGEAAFPRMRLAQGLTPEVAEGTAKMGQWLFSGYDPMDSIIVVPIMLGRARNKRENPADRNSPIACSSTDGVQGYGDPGRACRGCPFAQFTTDSRTGRRVAPACTLTYTYACWCPDVESFVEVSFSRTSEQAAHLINNLVQLHQLGKFAVRLTSNIIRGTGRIYAVPQIRLVALSADMVEGAAGFIDVPTQAALPAASE